MLRYLPIFLLPLALMGCVTEQRAALPMALAPSDTAQASCLTYGDVPTFGEQGFPGFVAETWFALFAPRGTPQDILDRINGYTRSIHDDPEMARRIASSYVSPFPLTQGEFAALVKADAVKWEKIVRETGVKLD